MKKQPSHPRPSSVVPGSTDGSVSPSLPVENPPGWTVASPSENPEPPNYIICDICEHKNPLGSRICLGCYAPLD